MAEMTELVERMRREGCSCVVGNGMNVRTFRERGVRDLLRLLREEPEALRRASVADKVVGKGAAALMAMGGVREVYALVMSRKALELLDREGVKIGYETLVDNIINRAGTDICPVEKLCAPCATAEECLPLIRRFVDGLGDSHK